MPPNTGSPTTMPPTTEAPLSTFMEVFTRLAGHAHVISTPAEFGAILDIVLQEHPADTLAVAGLPSKILTIIQGVCDARGISLMETPFVGMALPDAVDRARVGVTMAAFGVAETGSIVEMARHDADRLVSALPRVHVCLLRREDIVATLVEAAPRLREAFLLEDAATATFISGPSRTGDIEMKLTLGVHGPEVMHVVILDD